MKHTITVRIPGLAAGLILVAGALLATATAAGAATKHDKSASKSQVVATVGSMSISESELDAKAAPQLASIQSQIYQVKRRTLDSMIDDYLIDQAAKKAGLSRDAYLKQEVESKAAAPTDQEMHAFYDQNKGRISQPFDAIKAPLADYLRRQKLATAQADLTAKLRKDANVKVNLEPPRVEVSTADSAGTLGPAKAPVTVVEFSDYQCPFCGRAEGSVKEIRQKYGDKIRLVYMDFPLTIHNNAMRASVAARCAADQGKFWQYHDALFADQGKLDSSGLKATAKQLNLDTKTFDQCLDSNQHLQLIQRNQQEGLQAGVNGTPAFVINGRMLSGAQPPQAMESVIDEELAKPQKVKEASIN